MESGVILGDCLFLAASALGALYFLRLQNSALSVYAAAALVSAYSTLAMSAWYVAKGEVPFAGIPPAALLWQTMWQGVLIGFVALVAMNHAVTKLGGERAAVLLALVPVAGMALGAVFLQETPTNAEWLGAAAVSVGVALCAQAGRPASSKAPAKISAWGLSRPG